MSFNEGATSEEKCQSEYSLHCNSRNALNDGVH